MPVHIRTQVLTLFRICLFNDAEEMWEETIPAHSHNSAEYLICYRKVTFTKSKADTCRIQGNPIRNMYVFSFCSNHFHLTHEIPRLECWLFLYGRYTWCLKRWVAETCPTMSPSIKLDIAACSAVRIMRYHVNILCKLNWRCYASQRTFVLWSSKDRLITVDWKCLSRQWSCFFFLTAV